MEQPIETMEWEFIFAFEIHSILWPSDISASWLNICLWSTNSQQEAAKVVPSN